MDYDKGKEVQQLLQHTAEDVKIPESVTDVCTTSKHEDRTPSSLHQSDSQVTVTMPERVD